MLNRSPVYRLNWNLTHTETERVLKKSLIQKRWFNSIKPWLWFIFMFILMSLCDIMFLDVSLFLFSKISKTINQAYNLKFFNFDFLLCIEHWNLYNLINFDDIFFYLHALNAWFFIITELSNYRTKHKSELKTILCLFRIYTHNLKKQKVIKQQLLS